MFICIYWRRTAIRGFTDEEKQIIQQQLLKNAKKAFARNGIKKTSIEELTDSVGIAKGSFYMFYASKEELYFEVLKNEISAAVPAKGFAADPAQIPAKQMLRAFLRQAVQSMYENPILKLMLIPEEYQAVYRKIAAAGGGLQADAIIAPLTALIRQWQAGGIVIDEDPRLLANAIKCLFLLTTHEEEIGEAVFPGVISFMTDLIAERLAAPKR